MSEKTFLGKIIAAIVEVFKAGFPQFVERLFSKIPKEVRDKIAIIIDLVANIDEFVQSSTADIITAVIPGYADDELKEWLRRVLPVVLNKLKLITEEGDDFLIDSDPAVKATQLHAIATLLTQELTDVPFGQAAITAEVVYQNT